MKKALPLALAFVFITVLAHAQVEKGSVLLGGNLSFGNTKTENSDFNKQSGFSFTPTIGIAIKENYVVGVQGYYTNNKATYGSEFSKAENTFGGGGLFLRRYFLLAKRFYAYAQGNLLYNYIYSKQVNSSDNQSVQKTNGISISMAPGLAYALSKKFHLELGFNDMLRLSYDKAKTVNTAAGVQNTIKSNAFGFNTGLSTSSMPNYTLGFRVFLSK